MINDKTRNRHWSLTLYDYDGEDFCSAARRSGAEYARCQQEKCPETGRLHIQGCIGYKDPITFLQCKKRFPGAHIEVSRSPRAAWDYCGKEDTRVDGPWEHGSPPRPRRNKAGDRAAFNRQLLAKGAVQAFHDGDITAQDFKKVDASLDEIQHRSKEAPADLTELDNFWFYGPAGTGKSRDARREFPDCFDKLLNKWWDGYSGQETILLDDFSTEHKLLHHHLKRWADRYTFSAEVKGGVKQLRPKRIIVTSNYSIKDLFPTPELYEPIARRFKQVHYPAALLEIDNDD